jgi:predicted alpha-1,2-mannosidase
MYYKILSITILLFILACSSPELSQNKTKDLTHWVDPYIGTGYHGHVFLGANVPFGAVQVGPTNFTRGWDWCSGYHYSDSICIGFSQMHLSGTGIGDLGDVLVTPFTGEIKTTTGTIEEPFKGYASRYSHNQETAKPGYYSVILSDYQIKVELTATQRVALHKYTFPGQHQQHIAVNLASGIGWDKPKMCHFKQIDDTTFVGYRFSTGWAKDQRLFFALRVSKPVTGFALYEKGSLIKTSEAEEETLTGILSFDSQKSGPVYLKVGISPVSEENAIGNIDFELPGWDFEKVYADARLAWNKELSKVQVTTGDTARLRTFYTALYHAFIAPVIFNDSNGDYRGADKKVVRNPLFTNYSIFSLWDTYRAAHPLYTLAQPERVSDMVNTMLAIYQQQGKLPIWHLVGNETDCMVGYSAVPVVADAWFKGIKGLDTLKLFTAMKASAMRDDYGVNYLKKMGYIPADKEKESVSKALEYAVSDWCIAQAAKRMHNEDDYTYFSGRARQYKSYFDSTTDFMRPKLADGSFRTPFSPFRSIHEWGDYTEGNAWQYTWLVPQDVEGLIKLFGGDEAFIQKLDSLFIVNGDLGKNASPDISGLIGQYAQGNEPGHHIPYLYAYAGEQWKTAEKVRQILTTMYTDKIDGLCGNEDCGQMSAWYILSAMGFYQVNPASGAFVLGSPLFDEVNLQLPGNKYFKIKAINNSADNMYIQSATLNGIALERSYITYREIMTGGELQLIMGDIPNKEFGKKQENRPESKVYN